MGTANTGLRIGFAGTPEFAAAHLQALLAAHSNVVAVYTQPDRQAGRGRKLTASPVKNIAEQAGIAVYQPASLKEAEAQQAMAGLNLDVLVVVAYGLILPQAVLDIPAQGCLNVHGSLLPRWRGAAPIQRAIEAGDSESGICIMRMEAGLDTGPVLNQRSVALTENTTAAALHDQLIELGCPALLEVLDDLPGYLERATVQDDSLATYAHKITKAEAAIDWSQASGDIQRKVCAFNPFPVCWTQFEGEAIKVWRSELATDYPPAPPGTVVAQEQDALIVACGSGHLRLLQIQFPGSKSLPVAQQLLSRSDQLSPGKCFE